MNRNVLQFIFSVEHNLQVNNLSLFSLRSFNPEVVNFYLCLSPYFLAQFLEKLGPYYLRIFTKWIVKFPRLIMWLHETLVHSRMVYNWCYTTLESPPHLGNSNSPCTSYFGLIDQLIGWSLSLTKVPLHNWPSISMGSEMFYDNCIFLGIFFKERSNIHSKLTIVINNHLVNASSQPVNQPH